MIVEDIRAAFRRLLRRPGFLILGSTALGVGLAATLLVFAMVNLLLLKTPPGLHPEAPLVEIGRSNHGNGSFDTFSWPDFRSLREQTRTLDRVYATRLSPQYLNDGDQAYKVLSRAISGDYFDAMGVAPVLGRLFGPETDAEMAPGSATFAVASHAAFERYFGGHDDAIGSSLRLNGQTVTLIGVLPDSFHGHEAAINPDFYVPMNLMEALREVGSGFWTSRGSSAIMLGGRMAPGADLAAVKAELRTIAANLATEYPESNENKSFEAALLRAVPQEAQGVLMILSGGLFALCVAILLLAASNLAGVMLSQGEARRSELAMRGVLGASRWRIGWQLFAESLIVAAFAGSLALLFTWLGRDLLNTLPLPLDFPIDLRLPIDFRLIGACFGITGFVALACGLIPAWRNSQQAPGAGGQLVGAGGNLGGGRQRLRHALLGFQALLTVLLLFCAGLLVRGLQQANGIETGFDGRGVTVAEIDLNPMGLDSAEASRQMITLRERMASIPGVERAGFATVTPLTLSRLGFGAFRPSGTDVEFSRLDVNTVGEGFFDTFDIPVRGRAILDGDTADSEKVAVLNETAAAAFGVSKEDLIGKTFQLGRDEPVTVRVVGVVPDGRYASLGDSNTAFGFFPSSQWPRTSYSLFLRSGISLPLLQQQLKQAMTEQMPDVPVPTLRRFDDVTSVSVLPQRIMAFATSSLGVLALVLAATGLYGTLAYQVQRRYREFGLRKALGAGARRIVASLLRRTGFWLLGGVVLGLLFGVLIAHVAGDMLFGVGGFDPLVWSGVLLMFALICSVAMLLPLRRVLRLPPMEALRYE